MVTLTVGSGLGGDQGRRNRPARRDARTERTGQAPPAGLRPAGRRPSPVARRPRELTRPPKTPATGARMSAARGRMPRRPSATRLGGPGDRRNWSEHEGRAMKFTVERDALADAVAWVARALPTRPV